MDFDELVTESVIVIEHSADSRWCDFQEVSLQYCLAVGKTVCVLLCVRLGNFVMDDGMEDYSFLGVLYQID